MGTSSQTLKQKAYREMKEFLVIALYLWVVLVVLEVHKAIVLGRHLTDIASLGFGLVNALALGKVILIARGLHFAEFSCRAPLVYPTLVKAAAFSLLLACFKILEDASVGLYRGKSFTDSIADVGGGSFSGIFSVAAITFVVLIPFFAFAELQELIGEGKLAKAFLHTRQALHLPDHPSETIGPTLKQQGAE